MAIQRHSLTRAPVDIGAVLSLADGTDYSIQVIGGGHVYLLQVADGTRAPTEADDGRTLYAGARPEVVAATARETLYAWAPSGSARIAVWPTPERA